MSKNRCNMHVHRQERRHLIFMTWTFFFLYQTTQNFLDFYLHNFFDVIDLLKFFFIFCTNFDFVHFISPGRPLGCTLSLIHAFRSFHFIDVFSIISSANWTLHWKKDLRNLANIFIICIPSTSSSMILILSNMETPRILLNRPLANLQAIFGWKNAYLCMMIITC